MRHNQSIKIIRNASLGLFLAQALYVQNEALAGNGALMVSQITPVRDYAIADGTFINGWKWIFDITVPLDEPMLKLQFGNWSNGASTILAGDNVQYYSQYSSNATNSLKSMRVTAANNYGNSLVFDPSVDLDNLTDGIQTKVTVEARVPIQSVGNGYTSTYQVSSLPITAESTFDFALGSTDSPSTRSINAESGETTLWNKNVSVGTRAAKLQSLKLRVSGSAPSNTLSQFKLYVGNTEIASSTAVDINGDVTFDLSSNPYLMEVATTTYNMKVTALVSKLAANKNIRLTLQNANDIVVQDSIASTTYVTVTTNNGNVANNIRSGLLSVNSANVASFAKFVPAIPQIIGGANQYTLATYNVKVNSDDMNVSSLRFVVNASGMVTADSNNITMPNVSLFVNGVQVGIPQNIIFGSAFSYNNIVLTAGATNTIEIRGDVTTLAGMKYTAGNVRVDLLQGNSNMTGVNSPTITSSPAITGVIYSVVNTGAIVISSPGMSNFSTSSNATGVKIGSFIVQAGPFEGLTISGLRLSPSGAVQDDGNLVNLTIVDPVTGNTVGDVKSNPGFLNNYSAIYNMAASSTQTFDVYVDIASGATVAQQFSVNFSVIGRGVNSNDPISVSPVAGPVITIQ